MNLMWVWATVGGIYVAIRLSKLAKEVQVFFPNINLANFTVGYKILCITVRN